MSEWRVKVSRDVVLLIDAPDEDAAAERAFEVAWSWQPSEADGLDQGSVAVCVPQRRTWTGPVRSEHDAEG